MVAKTPPMDACTSCHYHQQEFADARCTPCHKDLRGYKPESAFRHEGNSIAAHGALARPSAETCVQCHDQTYCVACHSSATAPTRLENIFPERVERSFIHRGDYVSRHMIDEAANPASCRALPRLGLLRGVPRAAGALEGHDHGPRPRPAPGRVEQPHGRRAPPRRRAARHRQLRRLPRPGRGRDLCLLPQGGRHRRQGQQRPAPEEVPRRPLARRGAQERDVPRLPRLATREPTDAPPRPLPAPGRGRPFSGPAHVPSARGWWSTWTTIPSGPLT